MCVKKNCFQIFCQKISCLENICSKDKMQSNQVRAFSLLLNISSVFVLCPWLLIFVFYSNRFIILHMGLQKGIASIWAKEKCNCASDLLLPCTLLLNSNVWMNQRVLQNNQSIKSIASNIKKNESKGKEMVF